MSGLAPSGETVDNIVKLGKTLGIMSAASLGFNFIRNQVGSATGYNLPDALVDSTHMLMYFALWESGWIEVPTFGLSNALTGQRSAR